MNLNIDEIQAYISEISFVKKIYFFDKRDLIIYGKIKIAFDELHESLDFEVVIHPQYPLKGYGSESIRFINKDLIKCNHVMEDGHICIHTTHNSDTKKKLLIDFNSLKSWIIKYYINKDNDLNYEHIIVSESMVKDSYYSYIFTDIKSVFKNGDFGTVKLSFLYNGIYKEKGISNYIVQSFIKDQKQQIDCEWSTFYKNYKIAYFGFYIFIENTPAKYDRFVFQNWRDFEGVLTNDFLNILNNYEKKNSKKYEGNLIPLFIGYNTIKTEVHWQVAMLEIGKFPIHGIPEKVNEVKTGVWKSELIDQNISWALSRNASYNFFFGRGILSKKITDKKILIIGIGAIGSMVATTLVRGGCKFIDIADYDVKEPENVCRSEYLFNLGINDKVEELILILSAISPFVEISSFKRDYIETIMKVFYENQEANLAFTSMLNQYDIIFDCTTDNDLMYVLNSLKLTCDVINMSITNHAKELVCAFYPNIYQFVNNQFNNIFDNDIEDLYNPTGCWSPTFRASYNDIAVLVQLSVKHINNLFDEEIQKNNFIIKTDENNRLNLKIVEY